MEYIRELKVAIKIETNKGTYKKTLFIEDETIKQFTKRVKKTIKKLLE